jgi:hypothetical protein
VSTGTATVKQARVCGAPSGQVEATAGGGGTVVGAAVVGAAVEGAGVVGASVAAGTVLVAVGVDEPPSELQLAAVSITTTPRQ